MSYYNNPNQQYQQGYQPQQGFSHQGGYQPQTGYGQQHGYQQSLGQHSHHPTAGSGDEGGSDTGNYNGMTWVIKHRHTNSSLNVNLNPGDSVKSRPGAMIHMSSTVQLQAHVKLSMKKIFTGAQLAESTYTGPGTVAFAPLLFGDIITIEVQPGRPWSVGRHNFLACTSEVFKDTHSQGFGKGLFSGDGLFVYKMEGNGIAWLTSYGAIETINLQAGEQHVVDSGHLVAWNCEYNMEVAGKSTMGMMKSGEGMVCRFMGPGTVYIQTRNLEDFAHWVKEVAGSNS